MRTFDFSQRLIGIDGNNMVDSSRPHIELTLALALSEFIGSQVEGKTFKLYDWYRKLQKDKILQIDDTDKEDLIKMIEDSKQIYIYVKGQILEILKAENNK